MRSCTTKRKIFYFLVIGKKILVLIIYIYFSSFVNSQELTLDYIFQSPGIINPRPSLKFVSSDYSKIYYYADPDFNETLELFEFDFSTGEYFKFQDSIISPSEFIITDEGNAFFITESDIYYTKNFASKRIFEKELRITKTDEYEYSIQVTGNMIIYRRSGNYFVKSLSNPDLKELQIIKDESDRISYFPLATLFSADNSKGLGRIFIARYDDSLKEKLLIPDYTGEKVRMKIQKRGRALINLFEFEIKYNDSLYFLKNEIKIPAEKEYTVLSACYSPDNKTLVFDIVTIGNRSRKIFSLDLSSSKLTEIYSESDSTWFEHHRNPLTFLNNDEFIFESEVNGFNNIYKLKSDGSELKQLIGGNFHIREYKTDFVNNKIYFIANIDEPLQYHIYETDFDGSSFRKLTFEKGDYNNIKYNKDAKYLFYEYSNLNQPSEIFFLNKQDSSSKRITNSVSPKYTSVEWVMPELISFVNEEDGSRIYGYVYKPKNFSEEVKYPLICFAHGGAYLQIVTNGFPLYQNNFMFNSILTSLGFVVLEIDYRGSEGYGKDFRTKTFGNLGYWEMSDFISGINYLIKSNYIDKNRTGIYGASYGGFLSLTAAFKHQDYFKAAVSVKGVSDWEIHNQSNRWFTCSHLGDFNDETNKINYEISSPINFCDNLNIPLLILHGMLDDNVLFIDAVRLIRKLHEQNKNFEVMIYPDESHTFYKSTSLLDQYKRILKFFESNLK